MTKPSEPADDDADSTGAELVDAELPRHPDELPPIDFSTFVVSLRTSAMMHLGQHGAKEGQKDDVDLALARQEIDLLGVLEEKTRGNLTGQEELLLSQILFDLRTRYIAARSR
jgi:hypothetical protein